MTKKEMSELLKLIHDKVMPLVNVYKEVFWDKEYCHRVYDNELYEFEDITPEEFEILSKFKEKGIKS